MSEEDEADEVILKCMGKDNACREIATAIYDHAWYCKGCDPMATKKIGPGPEWDEFIKE
jgi:hypothetical protein